MVAKAAYDSQRIGRIILLRQKGRPMKRSCLAALVLLVSTTSLAKDQFDWPTYLRSRAPDAFESCKNYLLANIHDGSEHAPLVSDKVEMEFISQQSVSFDPFDANSTSVGGRFNRDRLTITMRVTNQSSLNAYPLGVTQIRP